MRGGSGDLQPSCCQLLLETLHLHAHMVMVGKAGPEISVHLVAEQQKVECERLVLKHFPFPWLILQEQQAIVMHRVTDKATRQAAHD